MGALWDFVTPAMLWQRSNPDERFRLKRIADIDWGPQIRARVIQNMTYWDRAKEKHVAVKTIGDLVHMSEAELLRQHRLGPTSLTKIKDVLHEHGLSLENSP
jgi:DNA-directed RNA polymerase alpha subunit